MTSIINNAFEAVKAAANHDEQVKALNVLKVTELRELAKWQSIRLTGKTRKADIIAAIIDGMRQNVIHFMENAMHGTRKSLNITRENLNENLNSAYLDNGYSFTPETIKTFAKAFYNIELGQGDALDLAREFLTKINSKIFKLVAYFDELDEAEAVVNKFENKHSKEERGFIAPEVVLEEIGKRQNRAEREDYLRSLNEEAVRNILKYAHRQENIPNFVLQRRCKGVEEMAFQEVINQAINVFFRMLEKKLWKCTTWQDVAAILKNNHVTADEARKIIRVSRVEPKLGNAKESVEAIIKGLKEASEASDVNCDGGGSCVCVKINPAPEIEAKLEACESFSEIINFTKENHITANEFYALADKSMQGLERKGLYEMAVNYCEAHCLELDTNKPYYERFEELFRYLVPGMGAADTLAGELIRALARIESRYYNDGDWIGIDYGRKTCNPSARFLRQYGNKNIADSIEALWTDIDERDYERHLSRLIFHVVNYIDANTEMKYLNFTVAIESCRDPEQDIDDDDGYDDERCNYTYEFKPFDLESLKGGEISNLFTRYNKIKEQYPSTLMLFKTGDYYKSYDRDAEITAKVLDIALHDVRQPGKLMRAEIPAHAIDFYARALNKRGFKTIVFEKSLEEVIAQEAEAA